MKTLLILLLLIQVAHSRDNKWVLDSEITDSNKFAHHNMAKPLLKKIIPHKFVSKRYNITLLDRVWGNLVFPGNKSIKKDSFLIVEGARPHSVQDKGLVWIDLKKSIGAFAINSCPFSSNIEYDCILIGTKNFSHDKLPTVFITVLKAWKKKLPQQNVVVKFIDSSGKITDTKF